MTPEVRVGVIGCAGFMSRTVHLPVLTQTGGVRLAAVCDARAEAAEQVAVRYGAERCATEALSVLQADDVDAVLILTPPWDHAWMTVAALAAGKSVFVEKPMCLCSDDAVDLTTTARERGLLLQVGYMKRFDPICNLARELLQTCAGQLGDLESFDAEVRLGRWRGPDAGQQPSGQPLSQRMGQARPAPTVPDTLGLPEWVAPADRSTYFTLISAFSHDLDLLGHLLGWPITARTARFTGESPEDVRSIDAEVSGRDAPGSLHLAVPRPPAQWLERFGLTFGRGSLELLIGAPLLPDARSTVTLVTDRGEFRWEGPARVAFRDQLHAFVSQLQRGGQGPPATYVGNLELAEQIHARSLVGASRP